MATCTTKAKCNVCKSEYGELNQDNHTPSTTWTNANGQHYHTCLNGCDTKLDTANCSGGSATCTTKAKCDVCKSEYGEVLGHIYQENWCSDEDFHWHECECGEKSDVAAHSWDNGIVTKEPTTKEEGERVFTCNDCGIQKIESIAKKEVPIGVIVGTTVGGAGVVGLGGFSFVWFVVKKKKWTDLIALFKK